MGVIAPLYLRGIVGFVFWHLERGISEPDTYDAMVNNRDFRGIPPTMLARAFQRGREDFAALQRLHQGGAQMPLINALGKVIAAEELIGVRVLFAPAPGCAGHQDASIVVNARGDWTQAQVLDAAYARATEIGLLADTLGNGPDCAYTAAVSQIMEGGFEAPSLELTEPP